MSDFRLRVFYTVAKRLSFTRASAELFITQPAVTKHIHELEDQYKAKLFERKGNRINLTGAGKLLLSQAEKIFELYRDVEFEINALTKRKEGLLQIGTSTTIAQYIVAPLLARFRNKFPDVQLSLITGNTGQIEKALLEKEIEIAIIEGYSKNTEISYHEFLKDEIVLVCSSQHPLANRNTLKIEELKGIKFILREQGSGTLEVIDHALKKAGINPSTLPVEIRLGNTESIKSYLLNAPCVAFLSVHAVVEELKRGELKVIDVENLAIERSFYIITLQGKITGLADLFFHFSQPHS
jgi:DNA-binding transcriptional LysR family regulator